MNMVYKDASYGSRHVYRMIYIDNTNTGSMQVYMVMAYTERAGGGLITAYEALVYEHNRSDGSV